VMLDEDASKLVGRTVRACRSCEQRQIDAKRYARRPVLAAILAMPAVALASGLLARRPDAFGAIAGAIVALVVASMVVRIVMRRRAARAPLLLIGADHDSMLVQMNAPASSAARSGYREAAVVPQEKGSPLSARPPCSSFAMPWAAGLMGSLAVCGIASTGALSPVRVLVVDSPNDEVRVSIDDGKKILIAAGGRAVSRVRSARHTYRVEYVATGHVATGTFEVEIFNDTLLTTDETQCYMVWVAQGARAQAHGEGRIRWTPVENARASERCQ
jgi:hypothetical protein